VVNRAGSRKIVQGKGQGDTNLWGKERTAAKLCNPKSKYELLKKISLAAQQKFKMTEKNKPNKKKGRENFYQGGI